MIPVTTPADNYTYIKPTRGLLERTGEDDSYFQSFVGENPNFPGFYDGPTRRPPITNRCPSCGYNLDNHYNENIYKRKRYTDNNDDCAPCTTKSVWPNREACEDAGRTWVTYKKKGRYGKRVQYCRAKYNCSGKTFKELYYC